MENHRDLVATVSGPGFGYGLARVLIDTEQNGVVFVPPGQVPVQAFKVKSLNAAGGEGILEDGGIIKFRRRGASCSYSLAQCNTKTATLMLRWEQWLAS
jgi:hypothetical protein